jgi:hypothetical protein
MVRTRLAAFAVAASLGLVSGCAELSQHSLFSWLHRPSCCAESGDCCAMDAGSFGEAGPGVVEGPMLEGGGPYVGQPGCQPAPVLTQPGVPQPVMPQLAPAPRLAPQAQPAPYVPSYRARTVGE